MHKSEKLSHEIKNISAVIETSTDLIAMLSQDEKTDRAISIIKGELKKLNEITNKL